MASFFMWLCGWLNFLIFPVLINVSNSDTVGLFIYSCIGIFVFKPNLLMSLLEKELRTVLRSLSFVVMRSRTKDPHRQSKDCVFETS